VAGEVDTEREDGDRDEIRGDGEQRGHRGLPSGGVHQVFPFRLTSLSASCELSMAIK
jgi:hypothetical protein